MRVSAACAHDESSEARANTGARACVDVRNQLKPGRTSSPVQIAEPQLHPRVGQRMEPEPRTGVLEAKQQEIREQKAVIEKCDIRVNKAKKEFEERKRELTAAQGDLWNQLKTLGEKEDELARVEAAQEEADKHFRKNRMGDGTSENKKGMRGARR